MESVYITLSGSYLRRQGSVLKVIKQGRVLDKVPAAGLKRLVLVGYISLTGAVMDFLISNRIETVFLTPTGRFRARLAIDEDRHVALRRAQYMNLGQKKFAGRLAARLVAGKISNMLSLLLDRGRRENNQRLKQAAASLKALQEMLGRDELPLERIRGIEGAATRLYYQAFECLIKNDQFFFRGRNRRPPRDPVNALLSFVYTLLTNEVLSAIKTKGLDPYLGALHEVSYGRPSLACDLVEEYRVLGERLVLALINRKIIRPSDFIFRKAPQNFVDNKQMRDLRPVEMKPEVMRTFLAAYEKMMSRQLHYKPLAQQTTYRMVVHRQVSSFGKTLVENRTDYMPFSPVY